MSEKRVKFVQFQVINRPVSKDNIQVLYGMDENGRIFIRECRTEGWTNWQTMENPEALDTYPAK